MVDEKLMAALKFTMEDLATNRLGSLSETQRKRLQAEERTIKAWSLAGGVVVALITVGCLYLAIKASTSSSWQAGILFYLGVLIGVLFSLILFQRLFSSPELIISHIDGMAKIDAAKRYDVNTRRNITYNELRIGGEHFIVSNNVKDLMQDKRFILYYINRSGEHPLDPSYLYSSRDILSVDTLEED